MNSLVRTVLLVSLALNIALGASLAWMVLQPQPTRGEMRAREGRPMFHPEQLRRALPAERSELIDSVLAAHRAGMRVRLTELAGAREAVREAVQHEPFDRNALDAAFADLRESERRTAQEAQALIGDLLQQLTPEERAQLSGLFTHPGRRGQRPPRETPR